MMQRMDRGELGAYALLIVLVVYEVAVFAYMPPQIVQHNTLRSEIHALENQVAALQNTILEMNQTILGGPKPVSKNVTISSKGRIKQVNVEVFNDSACTIPITEIDWGFIEPGQAVNRTIYVKNTGNYPHVIMSLTYANVTPAGFEQYMTLTWNLEGVEITKDEVREAILVLVVDESITGIDDFTFDIVVTGTG